MHPPTVAAMSMMKSAIYIFSIVLLVVTSSLCAGRKSLWYAEKAPQLIEREQITSCVFNIDNGTRSIVINYVAIDTMANAYGPASVYVNPVSYDPYSNCTVVVHRGKSSYSNAGSGGIYYAFSTDGGWTWAKRVGPLQGGLHSNGNGRYPNIALHNPFKASSKESVLVQYAFPIVIEGSFGGIIYGTEPGVGVNSPLSTIDSAGKPWLTGISMPTVIGDPSYLFAAEHYADSGSGAIAVFRSDDGVTFSHSIPAQLSKVVFSGDSIDGISGVVFQNGIYYIGLRAKFVQAPELEKHRYTFAVTRSTDKGKTWSDLDIVPWKGIVPADYAYNLFSNDFMVDKDSGYHFLTVGVDTNNTDELWSLFHIYKQNNGIWTATKIRDLSPHKNYKYGSLDQTLIECQLTLSPNGTIIYAKWIEDNRGSTLADSLPVADIWHNSWTKQSGWNHSFNRTSTFSINDQLTHVAQYFSNHGEIILTRHQSVTTSNNFEGLELHVTAIHISGLIMEVQDKDKISPIKYQLYQNYPNPFNPTTTISFSLPRSAATSLRVYTSIGQEVATLIDGEQQAGNHLITFDASRLAAGIYFYRLQTGSFAQTKKMAVVK